MSIVELKNVVKTFSGPQGNIVAVNNLSFQAKESGVLGILGPNGAGKTTTLRMIATIYKPDRGTIMVDGIDVLKDPLKVRSKIAYMPQEPDLIPSLSVEDHITYYLRFRGFDKKRSQKVLRRSPEIIQFGEAQKQKALSTQHWAKKTGSIGICFVCGSACDFS